MLADEGDENDVAIHWPRKWGRIATILRTGRCPSHAVPRRLRAGGTVALVDVEGNVLLVFKLNRIDEGVPVMSATGTKVANGCVLVARKGTTRRPGPRDPKVLGVNRHAVGAFSYFDASTYDRVVYEIGRERPGPAGSTRRGQSFPPRRYPFFSNNIGKTLSQPERELLRAYVTWVGDVEMFAHHPLKESGLFTDLFIPRCWTLVEAKASVMREVLRGAIGQLFDYQRFYTRRPRLAVLVPERPAAAILSLLDCKRIVAVWRGGNGSFFDSAGGVLTKSLRSIARDRARSAG